MSGPSAQLPHYRARTVRRGNRAYLVDKRGRYWPSVTTVLQATKPQAQREALARWRQRQGPARAQRIAAQASRRGTGTHAQIRRYLRGQSPSCPEGVRPYWESVRPVLAAIKRVQLVEGFVVHPQWQYGGRIDCIASYRSTPCLCEWKTADHPKGSVQRLYDAPLQLAAYWGAAWQCYRDCALALEGALLVVALPEMPAEVFWFDRRELAAYWQQWQGRLHQFWQLPEPPSQGDITQSGW